MKTEDFVAALGNINEKYVREMLEEDAAAGSEQDASAEQQSPALQPAIRMTAAKDAGPEQQDPENAGSRIFRYLVLIASAAACLFGVSRLMLLGQHSSPDDIVKDTLPTETATTMTAETVQTTETVSETKHLPEAVTTAAPKGSTSMKSSTTTAASSADPADRPATSAVSTETSAARSTATTAKTSDMQQTEPFTDGSFDICKFTMRKQPPENQSRRGGTLSINVVDMMTGEPIPGVTCSMFAYDPGNNQVYKDFKSWKSEADRVAYITELPVKKPYQFVLNCTDLPAGYTANGSGYSNMQMEFTLDGRTELDICARLVKEDEEPNIKVGMYDWGMQKETAIGKHLPYGSLRITNKDGIPVYGMMPFSEFSLPDGDYHMDVQMFGYPLQQLNPNSAFADYIRQLYPDVTFTDKRNGIDFSVKDGKPDKDLIIDLSPIDGDYNSITVSCTDSITGKPLEGVVISLIEAPDTYARKVAEWTSDATGTHTFDKLMHTGYQDNSAYLVRVESVPEGYSGGYEKRFDFAYITGLESTVDFTF